ncbi:hypothetical protein BGX38DRAFT_1207603 [Terfezia claveryi]|nr:hypothetical protein BGX38DRAFT_1207603 [Terfezia claveryi]
MESLGPLLFLPFSLLCIYDTLFISSGFRKRWVPTYRTLRVCFLFAFGSVFVSVCSWIVLSAFRALDLAD